MALAQPDREPTEEAFNGALLVAGFIRDVHMLRTTYVGLKHGDPVDDG